MKTGRIGLGLGLACAMIVAVGQIPASAAPNAALDIHFDGYCDGMHLNIPSLGLGTPGTVDGDHTGCVTGGFVGTTASSTKGARISTDYGGFAPQLYHFQVNADKTWTIYSISGDLQTYVNSGTWSPGPPTGVGQAAAG